MPRPSSAIVISAWGGATVHWTSISVASECRTALFMASWVMRSSSASTSGRSRWVLSSSITWIGTPEPPLRCRASEPMAVPRLSFSPTLVRSVRTERRTSPTTALSRSRSTWRRMLHIGTPDVGHDVVHQVAERRDLLGDPVVHLASQSAALLDRGGVAERREEQRRVEVHDVRLESAGEVAQRGVQSEGGRVEAGGEEPRDDGHRAGAAAQRQGERVLVDEDRLVSEGAVGELFGFPDLGLGPAVVVDDGGELLAALDVDDQTANGELVVHRVRDARREGDRLQSTVQSVGQPDELADQGLGVAVGVERPHGFAVRRVDEGPDQGEAEAEDRPGDQARRCRHGHVAGDHDDRAQARDLRQQGRHAPAAPRRRAAVKGGNARAVRIWKVWSRARPLATPTRAASA